MGKLPRNYSCNIGGLMVTQTTALGFTVGGSLCRCYAHQSPTRGTLHHAALSTSPSLHRLGILTSTNAFAGVKTGASFPLPPLGWMRVMFPASQLGNNALQGLDFKAI